MGLGYWGGILGFLYWSAFGGGAGGEGWVLQGRVYGHLDVS